MHILFFFCYLLTCFCFVVEVHIFLVLLCDACMLMLCFYFVIHIHRFYAVDRDVKFYYHNGLHKSRVFIVCKKKVPDSEYKF